VEYDVTQPPAGAIVAIKAVDRKFAQDLAKLTRTNVLFYAAGQKSASAAGDPAEETLLDPMVLELARLGDDKLYGEKGRTDVHMVGDTSGAMFQRLEGEGDAGFGVIRSKSVIAGPMGFLTGADDKDKVALTTTSSLATLIAIVILGIGIGILLSFLEHSVPIKEMVSQAARLKKGDIDLLQLPRFRGQLRDIATDLNTGIERVADKGGGAPRKAADLESILGPMPAQPAMSAFAFPMPGAQDSAPFPQVPPARASQPNAPPPAPHASAPHMPPMQKPATPPPGIPAAMQAPVIQQPMTQKMDMPPGALQRPETSPTVVKPLGMVDPPHARPPAQSSPQRAPVRMPDGEEEEATMVAAVPQDVLAAAAKPSEELAEWHQVYDEFLKVKKQCNEPTEGLSFEKFQLTLKKNRDALVERHKCKRVKFTVYVKDGRASLKATPVKD
jgi:hypothetical protein